MNRSPSARAAGHAVSLAFLAWFAGSPAAAQSYPPPAPYASPYYGVAPGQVLARVQSLGLRPMGEPVLRGQVWVVRAEGREGTLVRVLVDAETGRVVNIVAIERAYPPRLVSGGAVSEGPWVPMRGQGYDGFPPAADEVYPLPGGSRSLPGAKGGAEKKLAARPSTPLPKPRPSDAQDASRKDAPSVATVPQAPETTGSILSGDQKPHDKPDAASGMPAKTPDVPVSPLE